MSEADDYREEQARKAAAKKAEEDRQAIRLFVDETLENERERNPQTLPLAFSSMLCVVRGGNFFAF